MRSDYFMVLSKCFAPISSEAWDEVVSSDWSSFITGLSEDLAASSDKERIIGALSTPPSYAEKHQFAARHFTGGLPVSAMPIESLYTRKTPSDLPEYYQEPALYMKDLIQSLGYSIPEGFATYPDHITLELEVLALLLDSDEENARDFAATRFAWLPEFADKLKAFNAEGSFYAAAVDAVVALIDSWLGKK